MHMGCKLGVEEGEGGDCGTGELAEGANWLGMLEEVGLLVEGVVLALMVSVTWLDHWHSDTGKTLALLKVLRRQYLTGKTLTLLKELSRHYLTGKTLALLKELRRHYLTGKTLALLKEPRRQYFKCLVMKRPMLLCLMRSLIVTPKDTEEL
jgi:hypothetical protein